MTPIPTPRAFLSTRTNPRVCRAALGVTLPELLLVVAILAALGWQAIPQLRGTDTTRLEVAVAELAWAMRFARDQSKQTGVVHSVEFDEAESALRVVAYPDFDVLAVPPPVVRHPIRRNLYELDLDDQAQTRPTQISALDISFDGTADDNRIDFSEFGLPHFNRPGGTRHRALSARVTLTLNGFEMGVSVDPFTGRVAPDVAPALAGVSVSLGGP